MGKVSRLGSQPTSSFPGTLLSSLQPVQTGFMFWAAVTHPCFALPYCRHGELPQDRLAPGGSSTPSRPWKPSPAWMYPLSTGVSTGCSVGRDLELGPLQDAQNLDVTPRTCDPHREFKGSLHSEICSHKMRAFQTYM